MALRNIKISSEIVQNCKKCISGKSPNSTREISTTTHLLKKEGNDEVSNRIKIEFGNNPDRSNSEEMKSLQPAFLPHIRDSIPTFGCQEFDPFPVPVREYPKCSVRNEDGRILRSSIVINVPRSDFSKMSTAPRRNYSQRKRVDPNKGHECEKKKRKCNMHDCPRFHLENCKQSRGSDCRHFYQKPDCKKQFAPYPSYSESCAVRLPEDPSECTTCPWSKCRDVENIKPQKRRLHTGVRLPGATPFTIPPGVVMQLDRQKDGCDKKDPCKRPPGICEERKKKKKEQCDPPKKKYDPCKKMGMSSIWKNAYGIVKAKEDPLERDWVDLDTTDAGGLFATDKKRKGSRSDRESRRPKDSRHEEHEDGNSDRNRESKKKGGHDGKDDPSRRRCSSQTMMMSSHGKKKNDKEKCPEKEKEDCPKRKIRPVPIDRSINPKYKPQKGCCENEKKGRRDIVQKPRVFVPNRRT